MINKLLHSLRNSFDWWKLRKRLRLIKVIVLDVDGVLTDGGLWYGSNGEITKRFDVKDGLGIKLLQKAGLSIVFLSGGKGGSTDFRAHDLKVENCMTGVKDKALAIDSLCSEMGITSREILFVGDDLNDLILRNKVAILVSPSDANKTLRMNSDFTLTSVGGHGAIRELAERILNSLFSSAELSEKGWAERND